MNDENERSGASDGSVQPLAWGVMPGDNLPLWRCSSRRQAEEVVVWLRKQRPASTPQAVPLVDGRRPPTLTDAEREALERAVSCLLWQADCEREYERRDGRGPEISASRTADAASLSGLLKRTGGGNERRNA